MTPGNWLRKIATILLGGSSPKESGFWVHIRCSRCGEEMKKHVNPASDLIRGYSDDEPPFRYHKETVHGSCFNRLVIDITYDINLGIRSREIDGGSFVDSLET